MKRYILTGTPGAGKTSILHELKSQGYGVVEEAATEVIAREPHLRHDFIDAIVRLQKQRQLEAALAPSDLQWYDRSPVCTLALSRYLGYPPSAALLEELARIERERMYRGKCSSSNIWGSASKLRREKSRLKNRSCSSASMKHPTSRWATT